MLHKSFLETLASHAGVDDVQHELPPAQQGILFELARSDGKLRHGSKLRSAKGQTREVTVPVA